MKIKILKVISFVLCISILGSFTVYAVNGSGSGDKTLSEIEKSVNDYLLAYRSDIELHSHEYVDYLRLQLLEDSDKELIKHIENYDDFCVYASEYLIVLQANSPYFLPRLPDKIAKKTADEIRTEAAETKVDYVPDYMPFEMGQYNSNTAVEYARQYAKTRNKEYDNFIWGGDCTNFVSQCLFAGGLTMEKWQKVGTYDTIEYWYSYKRWEQHAQGGQYVYDCTTSWMRVGDLHDYLIGNGHATSTVVNSTTALYNEVSIGDIVQLSRGGGNFYHSIIITGGYNRNTLKYCGHSLDRLDEPLSSLEGTGNTEFRVIHPY